jgi:hypothetical protein
MKWACHERIMVVSFDDYDEYNLSIFLYFERNMLNPAASLECDLRSVNLSASSQYTHLKIVAMA